MRGRALLLLLPWLAACTDEGRAPEVPAAAPIAAEVAVVERRPIPETYETSGTLVTEDRVDIASRLTAYIRTVAVKEGHRVKPGQTLVTIDPTEIEAQRAEARARAAQAAARAGEARTDRQRYRELFEQRLIAANIYTKAELDAQVAEEELRAAEAAVARIEVQLQYTEIRSPVTGVVVARHKQAGDLATPGTPILTIENPANLVLQTYIREDHLRHVQVGDPVRIAVDAAALVTEGTVTRIVPSSDPLTRSYLVKATLGAREILKTGMFARAEFFIGEKQVILLPTSAIVYRSDLPGAYVVDDRAIAHFRMLRTGRAIDGATEILAGLQGGERIVVHSAVPLRTGDRIAAAETKR